MSADEPKLRKPLRLMDALPSALRELPTPLEPDELAGLRRILSSERVGNYRAVDYVCQRARPHRLAQVLDAPEGRLLLIGGLSARERAPSVNGRINRADARWRYRTDQIIVRVRDLPMWRAALPGLDGDTNVACRCGRHVLDLWQVPEDVLVNRPRVVLPLGRTAH